MNAQTKSLIQARLDRRRAERDDLTVQRNALVQQGQEIEGRLIRATIAAEELEAMLADDPPA